MSSGLNLFKSQIAYSDFKAKAVSQLLTKTDQKQPKTKENKMQNELLTNFRGAWIPATSVLPQDDAYVLIYIKNPEPDADPEMEEIILTAHVFEEHWIDSMSGKEIDKPMKDIWWRPFPDIKEIKQEPTK